MSRIGTALRLGSVVALAGLGYLGWQQSIPGWPAYASTAAAPTQTPATIPAADAPPVQPALPFVPDTAGGVNLPAQVFTASASAPLPSPEPDVPVSPFGLPCGLSVTGEAMPGAMVALDVMAPCRPGLRVEIEHAGLTLAAVTDRAGLLTMDIPALETPAFFTVRLADGEEAVTVAGLPDLIDFGRVAVSWQGAPGIELHAFEQGAGFGAPGHVWQEAPGSAADAAIGAGGFLTRLGDVSLAPAQLAQVYSHPLATVPAPRLSVDIPVTDATCGRPLSAHSHRVTPEGRVEARRITLTMPGCDAVGEYLVLQNLFDAPRLARN
ncbi:MAG: hypothetical protein N4A39_06230 [Roseicyclus sp.]|jgi:hypothetical protein|nr:hypothetical protein [Roseicyclus sp.]